MIAAEVRITRKGLIELLDRSPEVITYRNFTVRVGDYFKMIDGPDGPLFCHIPRKGCDGELVAFCAAAARADRTVTLAVVLKDETDQIAKAKPSSAWQTDYVYMGLTVALRRLVDQIPEGGD